VTPSLIASWAQVLRLIAFFCCLTLFSRVGEKTIQSQFFHRSSWVAPAGCGFQLVGSGWLWFSAGWLWLAVAESGCFWLALAVVVSGSLKLPRSSWLALAGCLRVSFWAPLWSPSWAIKRETTDVKTPATEETKLENGFHYGGKNW
jgi:hypothetical protein